jgi:ubiquitin carboxyl-terminal hydrolase 2/21
MTNSLDSVNGLSGLFNMGNTCYFNTIIQCLSNTKLLCAYLTTDEHMKVYEKKHISDYDNFISYRLGNLLKHMWSKNGVCIPRELSDVVGDVKKIFRRGAQNDAEEVLNCMLDNIHEECKLNAISEIQTTDSLTNNAITFWNGYIHNNYSIITDLFTGIFCNMMTCFECHNVVYKFEPFNILSISIPEDATTLEQCLEHFEKPELLTDDNQVRCEKCGKNTDTIKRIFIWEISSVLIIHLKRFKMNGKYAEKNNTSIHFPIVDLTLDKNYHPNYKREYKYNLYGIVNHSGDVGSGHYFAYCQNFMDNNWYQYNDSSVSIIHNFNSSVKSEGYIFMYVKK